MKKPQMKREVAIVMDVEVLRVIRFFSSLDALEDFKVFGKIENTNEEGQYRLTVDGRYDFKEVVEYISRYGTELME